VRKKPVFVGALLSMVAALATSGWSQDSGAKGSAAQAEPTKVARTGVNWQLKSADAGGTSRAPHLFVDFAQDQKQIWTSPARLRFADTAWLVPLGGITAGLLVTDQSYSNSLSHQASTLSHYSKISNVALGSLIGAGAGMYLLSFPKHNDHWRETGWLAGEAALNSLIVTETLKYSLGRQRPYQGTGTGSFFQGGTSLPSEHAAAAWAVAGVIAHEYPGVLPKLFAYGAAAAVDYSRVHARQHFPSDVLVGSVLGYLVAQSVYHRHHEAEVGGRAWEPPSEFVSEEGRHSPANMGSPYVPLDSWIYPALERLAAMGYVKTASFGLRPWTRLECARLVSEGSDLQAGEDGPPQAQEMYESLSQEFAHEFSLMGGDQNLHAQLESTYIRSTGISGTPLTDNQHFGQTLLNDYGRPYQEGFNNVAGISGWTSAGPFVIYARGEYQSAPSAPRPSAAVLGFISGVDNLPPNAPSLPIAATSRFELLDAYVGMNLANWQISYGRRSLWWGPSEGGTMLFTNNAGSLNNMFSIDRVTPFRLPWILRSLGDIRVQAFLGQLSGQEFLSTTFSGVTGPTIGQYGQTLHPQPFLSGEKISFKFTENFEFNMAKTTIYGGPGNPLTISTFLKSTFGKHVNGDVLGDGRSAVEFSYRIPKLRDWLTAYGEALTEDETQPLLFIRKSAFQGGLYFTKLPRLRKLDLRLEGGTTSPVDYRDCNGCFYYNLQYINGYTSHGAALGTWIGRAAQGEFLQTTYWLSPKTKIGLEFRHRKIDRQFLPQGGTQNDIALSTDLFVGPGFRVSGKLQYERWLVPLLAASPQSNVTANFQLSFWPAH
jgi:Capsule assembly protein Wzi/PAP2 superfamily